jgi:hypothetical protein
MWPLFSPQFPLLTYIPETNISHSGDANQSEDLEKNPQVQQTAQELFLKMPELNKELSSPKAVIHIPAKQDLSKNNIQEISPELSMSKITNSPEIDKANSTFNSIVPATPRHNFPLQSPRSFLGFSEGGQYCSSTGNLVKEKVSEVPEDKTFMFSSISKLDSKFVDENGVLTDAFFTPPEDLAEAEE